MKCRLRINKFMEEEAQYHKDGKLTKPEHKKEECDMIDPKHIRFPDEKETKIHGHEICPECKRHGFNEALRLCKKAVEETPEAECECER